jgi:hypothetical protein
MTYSTFDSGIIYAPYIPLMRTTVLYADNINPIYTPAEGVTIYGQKPMQPQKPIVFNKGDKLILSDDERQWHYTYIREEQHNSITKLCLRDEDGEYTLVTKATILKRMNWSWKHVPLDHNHFDEDLFNV